MKKLEVGGLFKKADKQWVKSKEESEVKKIVNKNFKRLQI